MTTIALGSRLCHRARFHVPWFGRWVLRLWFAGAPPTGKVTVRWGNTALVGTVVPTRSGESVGEGTCTIVGGAGWQQEPPATWLVDNMAAPARVAAQLAQAVGETLQAEPGAFLGAGNTLAPDGGEIVVVPPVQFVFARAKQPASATLTSLLVEGALWWVDFSGITRAAPTRTSPILTSLQLLEYHPEQRVARLNILEPSEAPIGGIIPAAAERYPELRVYGLDIEANEDGVFTFAQLAPPPRDGLPKLGALLELASRTPDPSPHGSIRGAAVQSQDAERRVSLRFEQRDKELDDGKPVPVWMGVPGVSATVFDGTRIKLAFERDDPRAPLAALWSPYGQAGHVPKQVWHEANDELSLVRASAGTVRVGSTTEPVAIAPDLRAYLEKLEAWAYQVDLALLTLFAGVLPPTLISAIEQRIGAAQYPPPPPAFPTPPAMPATFDFIVSERLEAE